MKSYVIDVSVIIKWIFPDPADENHIPQAIHLLNTIKQNTVKITQPSHWLVETAAVIVRLKFDIAMDAINLLNAMELPVIETLEIYKIACQISHKLNHHLFDTLYHAVALSHKNTTLITADEQYYRKAQKLGSIMRLADFSL